MMIEAGIGRQNDRARTRQLEHVLEMDRGQGRFAGDQHQLARFLQCYIGRALDQIVGHSRRYRRQRPHGARTNHHRIGRIRAGSDRREPFLAAESLQLPRSGAKSRAEKFRGIPRARRQRQIHFLTRDNLGGLRIQQIDPDARVEQAFQKPDAVRHARRTGQGQRDRFRLVQVHKDAVRCGANTENSHR